MARCTLILVFVAVSVVAQHTPPVVTKEAKRHAHAEAVARHKAHLESLAQIQQEKAARAQDLGHPTPTENQRICPKPDCFQSTVLGRAEGVAAASSRIAAQFRSGWAGCHMTIKN